MVLMRRIFLHFWLGCFLSLGSLVLLPIQETSAGTCVRGLNQSSCTINTIGVNNTGFDLYTTNPLMEFFFTVLTPSFTTTGSIYSGLGGNQAVGNVRFDQLFWADLYGNLGFNSAGAYRPLKTLTLADSAVVGLYGKYAVENTILGQSARLFLGRTNQIITGNPDFIMHPSASLSAGGAQIIFGDRDNSLSTGVLFSGGNLYFGGQSSYIELNTRNAAPGTYLPVANLDVVWGAKLQLNGALDVSGFTRPASGPGHGIVKLIWSSIYMNTDADLDARWFRSHGRHPKAAPSRLEMEGHAQADFSQRFESRETFVLLRDDADIRAGLSRDPGVGASFNEDGHIALYDNATFTASAFESYNSAGQYYPHRIRIEDNAIFRSLSYFDFATGGQLTIGPNALLEGGTSVTVANGSTLTFLMENNLLGTIATTSPFGQIAIDQSDIGVQMVGANTLTPGAHWKIADAGRNMTITSRLIPYWGASNTQYGLRLVRGDSALLTNLAPNADASQAYLLVVRRSSGSSGNTGNGGGNKRFDLRTDSGMIADQLLYVATENGNADEVESALKHSTNMASANAVSQAMAQHAGLVQRRLDSIVDTPSLIGYGPIAANALAVQSAGWFEAFGGIAEQHATSNINAYDAASGGIAFGFDRELAPDIWAGLSAGYVRNDIESKDANSTETVTDLYQLSAYGRMNVAQSSFLEGQLQYGYGENSQIRSGVGGLTDVPAESDFASHTVAGHLRFGKEFAFDQLQITPSVSATYIRHMTDRYAERIDPATGLSSLALMVDDTQRDTVQVTAGLDAGWQIVQESGLVFEPQLKAAFSYDLLDDPVTISSKFVDEGAVFKTSTPDNGLWSADFGAALRAGLSERVSLQTDYTLSLKDNYIGHSARLKMSLGF